MGGGLKHQARDRSLPGPADEERQALVGARSGNAGRNAFVQAQLAQARRQGRTLPLQQYDGDWFRAVPGEYRAGWLDHTYSRPGRYNRAGQSMLYGSSTAKGVVDEFGHYGGIGDRSLMRGRLTSSYVDASQGRFWGGALTTPYGDGGRYKPWIYRILGEDPYQVPRAFADGARSRGAGAIKVPAATSGASHVNLIPENLSPNAIDYLDHVEYRDGRPTRTAVDPSVKPMPPGDAPNLHAGDAPADARAHRRGRNPGLYGAAAGAGVRTLTSLLDDGRISADEGRAIAGDAAMGAGIAMADDRLTRFLAGGVDDVPVGGFNSAAVRSGAILDAVVSGGLSMWENADAFQRGEVSASRATADVVVDTGVGVASGLAGMAAGAAIGSVVPVAGTAVGAAIGFLTGMAASWLTSAALEGSGLADWAREGLTHFFDDNFSGSLERGWEAIAAAQDAVGDFAAQTWEGLKDLGDDALAAVAGFGSEAWEGLAELGAGAWDALARAGSETWEGLGELADDAWAALSDAGTQAWDTLADFGSESWDALQRVTSQGWGRLSRLGDEAWEALSDVGAGALEAAADLGSAVGEGVASIGSAIGEGLSSVGSTVAGWFGW